MIVLWVVLLPFSRIDLKVYSEVSNNLMVDDICLLEYTM